MTEILEKDKDNILTQLAAAGTHERSIRVLENEVDKILLLHNESTQSERERDTAAYILQAVRLSLPLIDSNGKTSVWEEKSSGSAQGRQDQDKKKGIGFRSVILGILAAAMLVLGLAPLIMPQLAAANTQARNDILLRGGYIIASVILACAAGRMARRGSKSGSAKHQVEIRVDADKLYRQLRTIMLSADQSLEEIRAAERWDKRDKVGSIDGRPAASPEIDLFSDLLAAAYSNDPEYALEKIDDIKYYLHRQQIEVVDYSEETKNYFDMMPGAAAGTIRPALVADGALLKKGLASGGR